MQDFLRNWVAHVRRAGIANVLVGAFDAATVSLCRELDLPHVSSLVWEYEGMATGGASLHSDNAPVIRHSAPLHALGILRAQLLVQLLARGHSVFVSDVDTVWLRDPADFLASHSSAAAVDVALGNDCVSVSGDEEREGWLNSQLNVGLVLLRSTPRALELVARWQGQLERPGTAHVNDQDLMWRVLQQLKHVSREGPWRFSVRMPTSGRAGDPSAFFTAEEAPHLLGSADGSGGAAAVPMPASAETYKGVNGLVLGVLPVALFMGGHPYFWQRLHERPGAAQPIVVHATFQFSHSHGKRQRFREEGLWLADPPEYYSGPNYLTFEPEEPAWEEIERAVVERRREERERAGDASAAGEPSDAAGGTDSLALIDRHMLQAHLHRLETYNALALSRALNRTLILPRSPCWCERYWGTALPACLLPHSEGSLPYKCPTDHLYFLANLDGLPWREDGLLRNERTPREVKEDVQRVAVGGGTEPSLPAFASDAQAAALLGDSPHRVLSVSGASRAFGRFVDPAAQSDFQRRMDRALDASVFFCAKDRQCRVGYEAPAQLEGDGASSLEGAAGGWWRERFPRSGGLGVVQAHGR